MRFWQRAHIYSLCTALGGTSTEDEGRYELGDEALAVLKDIRRWLKLYDEKLNRFDVRVNPSVNCAIH